MSSDYSARHLSVLEGLEAVRKRLGVYKGIVEVDGETKKILNSVSDNLTGQEAQRGLLGLERYSMISKRIW